MFIAPQGTLKMALRHHIDLAAVYKKMGFVSIENRWNRIPKENWSAECVPMTLYLAFEKNYIVSYADDDDSEDDDE